MAPFCGDHNDSFQFGHNHLLLDGLGDISFVVDKNMILVINFDSQRDVHKQQLSVVLNVIFRVSIKSLFIRLKELLSGGLFCYIKTSFHSSKSTSCCLFVMSTFLRTTSSTFLKVPSCSSLNIHLSSCIETPSDLKSLQSSVSMSFKKFHHIAYKNVFQLRFNVSLQHIFRTPERTFLEYFFLPPRQQLI